MNRRRQLTTVACTAALIAGTLSAATSASAAGPSISSAQVQVQFDTANGLPAQYTFPAWNNASLDGNDLNNGGGALSADSRNSSDTDFSGTNSLRFDHISIVSATEAQVFYNAYWSDGATKTASLAIQYDVSGVNVNVTLQNVTETPGYNLISVNLPSLLTVRQEEGGSPWILDANGGGRLTPLATTTVGTEPKVDFSSSGTPWYPVNAVGTTGATGALELTGYLDQPDDSVYNTGSNLHSTSGLEAQYRVRGTTATENILVDQTQIAKLTFAGDYDGNGTVNWLDLAKTMETQAPPIPSHYFDNKFAYMITGQNGNGGQVYTTFAQAQQTAARISNLIDGNPQVEQISGAFQGGHDTVEPNYTQVNTALGGLSGFKTAQANATNLYNTNLTLDDNYDDQYRDSYSCNTQVPSACYNTANIAHDQNNNLQSTQAWNGADTANISGMKKYVAGGQALTRADGTITTFGLHDGTLIDAMSTWDLRNDWDPAAPASGVDNLVAGKDKIVAEYAKHGIAVDSEVERYPMLGELAMTVNGPEGGGWNGGFTTEVPFMATALRHAIIYGGQDGSVTNGEMGMGETDPKTMLVNNVRSANWVVNGYNGFQATDQQISDDYYLDYLPWFLLSKLDVQSFTRSADGTSISETLSDTSGNTASIAINYATNHFSAVYDGAQIMNDYTVTVPMDSSRIAFFNGGPAGTMTYPLPAGVNPATVRASALYSDHRSDVPVTASNGTISLTVPNSTPVIVYLNQPAPTTVNDNSTAITYSGSGWGYYPNRGLGDVGNDVHATSTNGDAATVTFTGTGADLLTEKNSDEGTADVYLDGQLVKSINDNASSRSVQTPVYSVAGLPYGTHTVKVVNTSSSYLLIDAFKTYDDIPPTTTVNDTYSGLTYTGSGWSYHPNRALGDLSDDVHATQNNGDSVSYTFYGTGIDVISEKNSDEGAATVSIDGGTATAINGYAATRAVQQAVYSTRGLSSGPHTVTITNQSSAYLLLDGITTYN